MLAMLYIDNKQVFSPTDREYVMIYYIYVITNCTIIRSDIPIS